MPLSTMQMISRTPNTKDPHSSTQTGTDFGWRRSRINLEKSTVIKIGGHDTGNFDSQEKATKSEDGIYHDIRPGNFDKQMKLAKSCFIKPEVIKPRE
jgi:hypothetical protein